MKFSERVSNIYTMLLREIFSWYFQNISRVILCLQVKLKIYNPQNNWLRSILYLESENNSNYVTVYEYEYVYNVYIYVWCVMHTTESCTVCAGTV